MNSKRISLLLILILVVGIFFWVKTPSGPYLKIAGQKVKVELALTPEAQERGLSGREHLAQNTGMLFVFPDLRRHDFWMKDMKFAIDMIWLVPSTVEGSTENFNIIYIEKNATPESFPQTFGPVADSKYVLEVRAGFADQNNLKIGDRAELVY